MKNNTSLVYSVFLVAGDFVALLAAFTIAYVLRVTLDHTPISADVHALTYISLLATLLPFFLVVFALLGLYSSRAQWNRFREFGNLAVGCFIGIMGVISYSYVANVRIFPARLVTLYAFLLAFFLILLFRTIARGIRRSLFRYGIGVTRVLVVGDTPLSLELIRQLANTTATGYRVVGVVGCQNNHPESDIACYEDFAAATTALGHQVDMVAQTELYTSDIKNSEILVYAQENHLDYRFTPGNSSIFVGKLEAELFQSIPVIAVHQTALIGWGRVAKRATDLVLGSLALIIASPVMLAVAVAIKLYDGGPVFFRQERMTRGDKVFRIYKFRSHNRKYSGLSPEEGFAKMGRPDLLEAYRAHADSLPNDPRVTPIGRFIRRTKIDELGQLINVVKGDISLVGPRAIVPGELSAYKKRHAILSVKSGITGLAQVSGRDDISFSERRQLDLYYVQNWSFWGDLVIMAKTLVVVLAHKGTR